MMPVCHQRLRTEGRRDDCGLSAGRRRSPETLVRESDGQRANGVQLSSFRSSQQIFPCRWRYLSSKMWARAQACWHQHGKVAVRVDVCFFHAVQEVLANRVGVAKESCSLGNLTREHATAFGCTAWASCGRQNRGVWWRGSEK